MLLIEQAVRLIQLGLRAHMGGSEAVVREGIIGPADMHGGQLSMHGGQLSMHGGQLSMHGGS